MDSDLSTRVPRPSTRPQPIANVPLLILGSVCVICAIFILWQRADAVKRVVSRLELRSWPRREGGIRLSIDDGPAATEFIADEYDEDATERDPHNPHSHADNTINHHVDIEREVWGRIRTRSGGVGDAELGRTMPRWTHESTDSADPHTDASRLQEYASPPIPRYEQDNNSTPPSPVHPPLPPGL